MLAYLERLIIHSFAPLDSQLDWRLSFPYQIVFQKVRTKMDRTVRNIMHRFLYSVIVEDSRRKSIVPFSLFLFSLTRLSLNNQYVFMAFFRANAFPLRT